jgi:RNA polymerase sigma-70 factor, ECF subfamily
MIDRESLDRIHAQIVGGDVTASSDLFRTVHRALTAKLRQRLGTRISWDDAGDAATDAIMEYLQSPEKFDPLRGGLFGYLLLIARGDALNLARDQGNAKKNVARVVELSRGDGNTLEEAPDVKLDADRILRDHHADLIRDDGDEIVLRLYLQGEKATSAYVEALALSGLSSAEQQKVVKGWKDRIELRLKRLRGVLK